MKGRAIEKMTNHAHPPGSENFAILYSQLDPKLLFSLCGGPVLLSLEGYHTIWVNTEPTLMSVIVGIERNEKG